MNSIEKSIYVATIFEVNSVIEIQIIPTFRQASLSGLLQGNSENNQKYI